MKLEPLKNKKHQIKQGNKQQSQMKDSTFYSGFQKGVETSFEIFESLLTLYKRYRNNVKLLMEEQQEVWKTWVAFYEKQSDITQETFLDRYNEWLFDYTFEGNSKENTESLLKL